MSNRANIDIDNDKYQLDERNSDSDDSNYKKATANDKGAKIRLTLDVSPELNNTLNELADKGNTSKSNILRRAIALMKLAVQAQEEGGKVILVSDDKSETREIVGLY